MKSEQGILPRAMVFKLFDLNSLKPFERYTFTLTDGKDGPNCNKNLRAK